MDKHIWHPYTEMDLNSQKDRYVFDTRDYHISAWERENNEDPIFEEFIEKIVESGGEDYIISPVQMINLFEQIKTWKRVNNTIILSVNQSPFFTGWLKYIRLKKVSENKYIVYTTSGKEYYPIDWRNIINSAKV